MKGRIYKQILAAIGMAGAAVGYAPTDTEALHFQNHFFGHFPRHNTGFAVFINWPVWRYPVYDAVYASPSPNVVGYANSAEIERRSAEAYQRGATDTTMGWLRQENERLRGQLEAKAAPQPAKYAAVLPTPPNVVVAVPASDREAAIDKINADLADKQGFIGRRGGELPRFATPSYSGKANERDVTCGVVGVIVDTANRKNFVLDAEPREPGCPERNAAVIQEAQRQGAAVTYYVYGPSSGKTPEAWLREIGLK